MQHWREGMSWSKVSTKNFEKGMTTKRFRLRPSSIPTCPWNSRSPALANPGSACGNHAGAGQLSPVRETNKPGSRTVVRTWSPLGDPFGGSSNPKGFMATYSLTTTSCGGAVFLQGRHQCHTNTVPAEGSESPNSVLPWRPTRRCIRSRGGDNRWPFLLICKDWTRN